MHRFGRNTYQIEAGYLNYLMISFTLLLMKNLILQVVNSIKNMVLTIKFFNVDSSVSILYNPFKFGSYSTTSKEPSRF